MIKVDIPGKGELSLEHVVFDVNGTLAVDGKIHPDISDLLQELKSVLTIHLLTADTHGKQSQIDQILGLKATRISPGDESRQKGAFIANLGPDRTAAVGQGANDALMLEEARLGICIISPEGTALETLLKADLVVPNNISALEILLNPMRLKASLRK